MSSFRIRPRFRHVLPGDDPAAVQARIVERLRVGEGRCEIRSYPGYVNLRIPEADQHLWSPQLNLGFESDEHGGTLIRGTYGPGTNCWAMFLYGYLFTGFLGIISALLAFTQWTLGDRPWALWVLAGAASGAAGLYVLAQTGQKLGAQQTFQLHQAYEAAAGEPVPVR
jgi:hypothetical protein